jgi:hypothetical protein
MSSRSVVLILAVVALALLAASVALAQVGGGYDLSWNHVGPGGTSSGGEYSLSGTAGQADAGLHAGGMYLLGGGFWGGGALTRQPYEEYLPLVLR